MKRYDFKRAQEIIEVEKLNGLVSATLGMFEDWNWTADEVWNKEYFYTEDFFAQNIAGISGSGWATPYMSLIYEDGSEKAFAMYTQLTERFSAEDIAKMKSFAAATGGHKKEQDSLLYIVRQHNGSATSSYGEGCGFNSHLNDQMTSQLAVVGSIPKEVQVPGQFNWNKTMPS